MWAASPPGESGTVAQALQPSTRTPGAPGASPPTGRPPRAASRPSVRVARTALRAGTPALGAGVLLWLALPRVTGVAWGRIAEVLADVGWGWVVGLLLVWVAGLAVQTVALVAALPGLTHGRALVLNLTGSCVSDLLPVGGAAGTAVNYAMTRSWGFSRPAFVRWAAVTNIWDTGLRLLMPTVALLWLAAAGERVPGLGRAATTGAAGLVLFGALVTAALVLGSWPRAAGRLLDRGARLLGRGAVPGGWTRQLVELVETTASLLRSTWLPLAVGKVGFALLQALLLLLSLRAVGADLTPVVVFAGFAMERVLTLAVLTPGATGFVEVGMAALLVALGAEPAHAVAGVLLYRFYTFVLEIPVGGLGLLVWLRSSRDRSRPAGARGR